MLLQGQQMTPVPSHQVVSESLHSALQDAVVRVAALEHLREPAGFDDDGSISQHTESLGRAFLCPFELAHKHPGNLFRDERGQAQIKPPPEVLTSSVYCIGYGGG